MSQLLRNHFFVKTSYWANFSYLCSEKLLNSARGIAPRLPEPSPKASHPKKLMASRIDTGRWDKADRSYADVKAFCYKLLILHRVHEKTVILHTLP